VGYPDGGGDADGIYVVDECIMNDKCKYCNGYEICCDRRDAGCLYWCRKAGLNFCLGFSKRWYYFWKRV